MKARYFYLIMLGLLLHPGKSVALKTKQYDHFTHSFQKSLQENFAADEDPENLNSFFTAPVNADEDVSADDDLDDDDDVSFSARKKISFEVNAIIIASLYTVTDPGNTPPKKYYTSYFYHLPLSHFISLRVFRI